MWFEEKVGFSVVGVFCGVAPKNTWECWALNLCPPKNKVISNHKICHLGIFWPNLLIRKWMTQIHLDHWFFLTGHTLHGTQHVCITVWPADDFFEGHHLRINPGTSRAAWHQSWLYNTTVGFSRWYPFQPFQAVAKSVFGIQDKPSVLGSPQQWVDFFGHLL